VITPVYNGEKHLAECIDSVLAQNYPNYNYLLVNNCSTDRTLEIAEAYAKRHERIRIHNNTEFLGVVESHNRAFSLAPHESKYIKIVGADDWLFPNCLAEMVSVAEEYPSIGMVSSYVLVGSKIGWAGLPFPSTFVDGRKLCRMRMLDRILVFGGPSASLLRNMVVQEQQPFYKVGNYHGDNEAYLDLLRKHDFGFVHQVLSYNRRGEDSPTTQRLESLNSDMPAAIEELVRWGPVYLSKEELESCLNRATRAYYEFLAHSVLDFRGKEFWDYHRERLAAMGSSIDLLKLSRFLSYRVLDLLLNPKRTVENVFKRVFR
jgi:glycosyltransferase involved in cell wall biosynthesis